MNPLEWVADFATSGMIVAFNFFTAHPRLSGGLTVLFGGSWLATNVVRGWWPEPGRRPRWARVAVEVCGPVAAVVRGGLRRLAGKVGREEAGKRPAGRPGRRSGAIRARKTGDRPRKGGRAS